MNAKWIRVTRQNKCPVCEHPDWCTIGEKWICCMRVQSDHPSKNGGWFHPLGEGFHPPKPTLTEETPHINATKLMQEFRLNTSRASVEALSGHLEVSFDSLNSLGVAWAEPYRAWAFPMRDDYGNTIGIRLRNDQGKKWAVRGSRAGLFFADGPICGEVYILEGPTDTAAALTIGLQAIGRPSCQGQEALICARLRSARRVVIVADNDDPGVIGAQRLQGMLKVPSIIWCPPGKDMRDFIRNGGRRELLDALLRSMRWTVPETNTARPIGDYIAEMRKACDA